MTEKQDEAFDYIPCDCGDHFGLGTWTAEKRAGVYAWYRDKRRQGFTRDMFIWLASYQRKHGPQQPNI